MSNWGNSWGYEISGQPEGNLTYHIRAVDTSGNENITLDYTIQIVQPLIPDTTPPTIISVYPTGANVSVSESIIIQFSEQMNESSVMDALSFNPDIDLGLIIDKNGETITINHYDLEPGTTYRITISESAMDMSGNYLAEDYSWEFTTEEVSVGPLPENNAWIGIIILMISFIVLLVVSRVYKEY